MGFYSIVATAPRPVALPAWLVMIDTGLNVFTSQTDDLEGLLAALKDEGVAVQEVNQLDGPSSNTDQPLAALILDQHGNEDLP